MALVPQYPVLEMVWITAHQQDLLLVVGFQQQQIGADYFVEYGIGDEAYVGDDAYLAIFTVYGKTYRIRRVVGDGEGTYHEIIYVKILSGPEKALLLGRRRFLYGLPCSLIGIYGHTGQLLGQYRDTFDMICVLVGDEQ